MAALGRRKGACRAWEGLLQGELDAPHVVGTVGDAVGWSWVGRGEAIYEVECL